MGLNDLSAEELARIDSVCLQFEADLRNGKQCDVDSVLNAYQGPHADVLRQELLAIEDEVQLTLSGKTTTQPFGLSHAAHDTKVDAGLPAEGSVIGPYQIRGRLGQGGMGVVFDGFDLRLRRKVAIKMLSIKGAQRQMMIERFEREARAVAALSHPNIVELFDVGDRMGTPYAVMEFLNGETLDERLKRQPLTASEVRFVGREVAQALAVAHAGSVMHRDLKPENIMLVAPNESTKNIHDADVTDLRIKIFDFGLSRSPMPSESELDRTKAGVVLGTPGYMSPEQARGEEATVATDIFSLGCVLYQAFFSKRAFDGATIADRIASTLKDDPDFDPVRCQDDATVAHLIKACLNREPSARPAADEIASTLVTPEYVEVTHGLSNRRMFLLSASGGIAGAVSGAVVSQRTVLDIDSIAVLPLKDERDPFAAEKANDGQPLGQRPIGHGEELAIVLVNELSKLGDIEVRPYRSFVVESAEEYVKLGTELNVNAFVGGSITRKGDYQDVQIEIVSAVDGNQLWGRRFTVRRGDSLLQQSKIANDIAKVIGRRLTSSDEEFAALGGSKFHCMLDGKARSDPESIQGLEMSLTCFRRAIAADVSFAEPHAGLALTLISLAGQCEPDKTLEYILESRKEFQEALRIDNMSEDARLAESIDKWQARQEYRSAKMMLQELEMKVPYNWQVKHQLGWLLMTMGDRGAGIKLLKSASKLNPLSVLVKVDLARAKWFGGANVDDILADVKRLMDRHDGHELARGLLIDIYEDLGRFDQAAQLQSEMPEVGKDRTKYAAERQKRLVQFPYGPFGPQMNQVLYEGRFTEVTSDRLADLISNQTPTLPMLLANHPALAAAATKPRALDILPGATATTSTG